MHKPLFILLCAALGGCAAAPAPQGPVSTTEVLQPFAMPMDPGQIACGSLANPAALTAATDWVMGQLRAQVMAGQRAATPPAAEVAAQLQTACQGNPAGTLRAVAAGLGV